MLQNEQTEPKPKLWFTRRRTCVRRVARFVRSKKIYKYGKIEQMRFFCHIKCFETYKLIVFLSLLSFCGLDFFYISYVISSILYGVI